MNAISCLFLAGRWLPGLVGMGLILLLSGCSAGGEPDTTPPAVVGVSPAANAADVSVGSTIEVTFSEPVRPDSIDSDTFRVRENGSPLAGSFTVSGNRVVFHPATSLATLATYVITLTTGIRDPAGNPLAADFAWTFHTVALATVEVSWSPSRARAVNDSGGGYRLYYDTTANFTPAPGVNEIDIPWPGSGQTPSSATLDLPAGTYYFKVIAYSALAGGTQSLPSAQTTINVR